MKWVRGRSVLREPFTALVVNDREISRYRHLADGRFHTNGYRQPVATEQEAREQLIARCAVLLAPVIPEVSVVPRGKPWWKRWFGKENAR